MISKERLKELIEQGATIYSNEYGEIQLKKENDLSLYENGQNNYILYALEPNKKYHNEIFDEDLFETEEEAKWFAEFGCIDRTERLELPTWEEFKNKKTKHVCFMGKDTFCFFDLYEDKQKNRLILLDHDCDYEYFNEELTKENYTTACGLCKEFFLGEKK